MTTWISLTVTIMFPTTIFSSQLKTVHKRAKVQHPIINSVLVLCPTQWPGMEAMLIRPRLSMAL
jgi:hypothetical protein